MGDVCWGYVARFLARHPRVVEALLSYAKRTPYWHLRGYMNRWWVWPFMYGKEWMPFRIRVHEILRADTDPDLHDHPWAFRTMILRGYYTEEYLAGGVLCRRLLRAGETARNGAEHYHRIISVSDSTFGDTVTTLVILGKKKDRTWGFLVNGVHVPYPEYESTKANVVDDPAYRAYVAEGGGGV